MASQMPASVHSLADAARRPNENVDAVIRHYKAINAELEAQLAVALAQRDAWRELAERCWQFIDAERALVHINRDLPSARLPRGH
jgi:hypothetical protein